MTIERRSGSSENSIVNDMHNQNKSPASSAGNEMKNERLRLRWLGSAVSELRTELSQVLRARNASEELAERSRLSSGMQLLRSDVSGTGRTVRELANRLTRIEAGLSTLRLDIVADKERSSQMSNTCADLADQVCVGCFSLYRYIVFGSDYTVYIDIHRLVCIYLAPARACFVSLDRPTGCC